MDEDKIVAAVMAAGTLAALGANRVQGMPADELAESGMKYYRAYLKALEKERESAVAPPTST